MTEYFVLHAGRGTDGGFGDYSPPYWSEDPVEDRGRVVWFITREEADEAVGKLNAAASEAFYSTGTHSSYDGMFPVEYEVRRITVPEHEPVRVPVGVWMVSRADRESWLEQY